VPKPEQRKPAVAANSKLLPAPRPEAGPSWPWLCAGQAAPGGGAGVRAAGGCDSSKAARSLTWARLATITRTRLAQPSPPGSARAGSLTRVDRTVALASLASIMSTASSRVCSFRGICICRAAFARVAAARDAGATRRFTLPRRADRQRFSADSLRSYPQAAAAVPQRWPLRGRWAGALRLQRLHLFRVLRSNVTLPASMQQCGLSQPRMAAASAR
jgi:hypothetical protein